ncbi:MAG: TolC family outer membrane protein [Pseudomonadota bacterium]
MKKQLITLGMAFLVTISTSVTAQNLNEIYQLALQNDAELLIAESSYLSSLEAVPLARSGNRPQVFLNANGSLRESENSDSGHNSNQTIGYGISLTQSLYNTDTSANINTAEADSAAELARLEATRQNLILRTAEIYFSILAAQDSVDFAYAERTAIARQLEQAQKRFEVGLIAITGVHEAQAAFDIAEADVILAENQLETAHQSLLVITGLNQSAQLSRLGDSLDLNLPEPIGSVAWVELAMENNRDLIAARENLNAARSERQRSGSNRNPTVDLTATYSDNDVNDDLIGDSRQGDITVGVELKMPLFVGGRLNAEQAQAEANYQSAQNSVLLQSRLASQRVRTAYLNVVSGISQVNALKQALDSTVVALEATQAGFEVGTRTSVDVLVSLRETYRAQRDYASARYDYLINTLRLKEAAGILAEKDLTEINRWLKG